MLTRWFRDNLELTDDARQALQGVVHGEGPLAGEERDELLLELNVGLFDRGLRHKGFRSMTQSLRRFLKHLHEKFELRYLQGLPEVRSRLHWAAEEQSGQGSKLAALCLETCIDDLLVARGETLQLPVLRKRVRAVEQLVEDWSGILEQLS